MRTTNPVSTLKTPAAQNHPHENSVVPSRDWQGDTALRHDLTTGYELEDPPVKVPWGLSPRELLRLLAPYGMKKVSANCYVVSCTSLCGLRHKVEFRYDQSCGSRKYSLRLFQSKRLDVTASYEEFQRHLELKYGLPSSSEECEDGFMYHAWRIGDFTVSHSVVDHFYLREAVVISPLVVQPPLYVRLWQTVVLAFVCERFLLIRIFLLFIPLLLAAYITIKRIWQ